MVRQHAAVHPCHRGPQGWHGTRERWTLRRMDPMKAIDKTYRRLNAAGGGR